MVADNIALDLQGLTTKFGSKVVHKGLNLKIYKNEVLVLFGGSGTGKSTLLRLLIGLETPHQGQCLFSGKNLFELSEADWLPFRQKIAYAFQGGALFDSLTVGENLEYPLILNTDMPPEERAALATKTLGELGLPDTEKLYPSALSGGMQKRVGIARAVIMNPEVILYDEPTAGLDPANSKRISEMIKTLNTEGKSSVVVTHDVGSALAVGDRFAFLADGVVEVTQTREELERDPHPSFTRYMNGELA
jgi:phospholipid/cholesterol/gamma-HCH transport system ATP-binding protein